MDAMRSDYLVWLIRHRKYRSTLQVTRDAFNISEIIKIPFQTASYSRLHCPSQTTFAMNQSDQADPLRRQLLGVIASAIAAPTALLGSSSAPAVRAQSAGASPYTIVAAYFGGWQNPPDVHTPWYPPDIWGAYGAPYSGTFTVAADGVTLNVSLTSGSIVQTNPTYPAIGSQVKVSSTGKLPQPLQAGTIYYALAVPGSTNTVKLFKSYQDAVGGTTAPIALQGGSGTFTISVSAIAAHGANLGWFMGSHPERFPTMGTLDESQQAVMDKHISVASSYGVNVFAINWYRDDFLTYATQNYMASPNKMQMRWFMQWSNNANSSSDPTIPTNSQQFFFEGIRRAATHMSDAAYYRINGLPVFSIFYPQQIDTIVQAIAGTTLPLAQLRTARAQFLGSCQQIVANVLAGDPTGGISGIGNACTVSCNTSGNYVHAMHLLICGGDVGGWANLGPVDGMYAYNIRGGTFDGVTRAPHSFDEQVQAIEQFSSLVIPATNSTYAPGRTFWPTIMTGWNMQPWGGSSDPLADYTLPTAAQFQNLCSIVKKNYLDTYAQTAKTVFVYAWNELGEGGFIEPTNGYGTGYLQALQSVFWSASGS